MTVIRPAIAFIILTLLGLAAGCGNDPSTGSTPPQLPQPLCNNSDTLRIDIRTPQSMVSDWGTPVRLDEPVNSHCPQDAIEISDNGQWLYVMYTEDLLDSMPDDRILARANNTYRLPRVGGPGEFGDPVYYDLASGQSGTLDGECSFAGDSLVYFHSLRATNTGYQQQPVVDDILDIYVAPLFNGLPGTARSLGPPINTEFWDGEGTIHPDGVTLYFGSTRPGGYGMADIWTSQWNGTVWSTPVNLGPAINSAFNDYQPTFTRDGDTMYFASMRNPLIGMAIYRTVGSGTNWTAPQLVIQGLVGEPALTADGELLYFVHILSDSLGNYDSDIWYCERN